jgi:hypothetical protein
LSLPVDLTEGKDWQATSIAWCPRDETGGCLRVHTQSTERASGASMSVFLRGYHPCGARDGAMLFDDVRVLDLGPGSQDLEYGWGWMSPLVFERVTCGLPRTLIGLRMSSKASGERERVE